MKPDTRACVALSLAAALAGCGAAELGPADAGGAPDADLVVDGGADAPDPFAEVDRIARERAPAVGPFGLAIYTPGADGTADRLVFQRMYGDFVADRRVAVASASKMVAGLVLFRLITDGRLRLDSTTGEVLGWTGPKAAITLRHLMSFTSGLPPDATCTLISNIRLQDCVAQIERMDPVAAPGARFDYGSTHLHVAGRMAEVAGGKPWAELFSEQIRAPLGLPPQVVFYTLPMQGTGTQNPLIAGGLHASMDEYAALLGLVFRRGVLGPNRLIRDDLFSDQARAPYPAAVIGESPAQQVGYDYRYGLTAWLECATPAEGCAVVSSPGAFGWTPWLDRAAGYYAMIGTLNGKSQGKVVKASMDAAAALKPAIARALAR